MKRTRKEFNQFQQYCLKYQKDWDLSEWRICFQFEKLGDSNAKTAFNLEAHQATIALNTDKDPIEEDLKRLAKHEMLHVLLGRMGELAQYRYTIFRELDSAEHSVINKLIKLIPN